MNDLESIEAILSWRDYKARQIGLKEVDKELLKMEKKAQEVMISAAVKNNFQIVRTLYSDGYKILDKMTDDRFFFSEGNENYFRIKIAWKLQNLVAFSFINFKIYNIFLER